MTSINALISDAALLTSVSTITSNVSSGTVIFYRGDGLWSSPSSNHIVATLSAIWVLLFSVSLVSSLINTGVCCTSRISPSSGYDIRLSWDSDIVPNTSNSLWQYVECLTYLLSLALGLYCGLGSSSTISTLNTNTFASLK